MSPLSLMIAIQKAEADGFHHFAAALRAVLMINLAAERDNRRAGA